MQDCIFCRIAAGEVPAVRSWNPGGTGLPGYRPGELRPHPGHPQSHHQNLLELPDALWTAMGQACRRVARPWGDAIRQGFNSP